MTQDQGLDRGRSVFLEEAAELLSDLEDSLLELEESPDDQELIGSVFRAMHTIKGSGAMFGFDDVSSFTHEVETVFDKVREGIIPVTRGLIDLTLAARDQIRAMLEESQGGEPADFATSRDVVERLRALLPEEGSSVTSEQAETASCPTGDEKDNSPEFEEVTYRIRFRPARDIFATGSQPTLLLDELRELGPCQVMAQTQDIPALDELDPESCYMYWDIVLTTNKGINAIKDVFIFVEDDSEISIEEVDAPGESGEENVIAHKKLGEILTERGDVNPEELEKALSKQKRIGEILVEEKAVSPGQIESALTEQKHVKTIREKRKAKETVSSIRVASPKLDQLVNLVGELVTVQARLSQMAISRNDPQLTFLSEEVERLTSELRDNTMSIRMLPIGTTFSKFRRLVRDLSKNLQKEVVMTTEGAETELDKTVIEKLNDPLVHLIRNSIDHGIEPPEVREAAGKPRQGTVHLSALHSGANVYIRIRDDGAGIDPDVIRAKAIEKGLVSRDTVLTDKEAFGMLFAPGFSTANQVTDVSGRGVGMDVVKTNIESLRGSIDIESELGKGTTVTLKLPLTLAIIEGLLARIGEERYVLPLSSVEECIELVHEDATSDHGRRLVNVRGEIVPYISVREQFAIPGEPPTIEQIVITEVDGQRIGVVVDEVIGEHQTVIKSMGRLYKGLKEISGATILGDGSVALIIDLANLAHSAAAQERQLH